MFDSIKAIINVNKIIKGEKKYLSQSQIVALIINLFDAHKNLHKIDYNKVIALYKYYRKNKQKVLMDKNFYYETCLEMISKFNEIAPHELYSGER